MSKYLSVIVPCYNEQARIAHTLDALFSYLPHLARSWEIIAVDDGSTDQTWEILDTYRRVYSHFIPLRCEHKGKGNAVRVGMLTGEGQYRLFMDADLSTPLAEIPRALEHMGRGADVVIGSREVDPSRVEATAKRRVMGRVFHWFAADLTPGLLDTQCGFKMFRWDVARRLFRLSQLNGFAFDVEVLYLAHLAGYKVHEMPVRWAHHDSQWSKTRASLEMLRDVWRLPWLHRETYFEIGKRSPNSSI
jgi:dolichyl-phosphate beta-glucosyltransferase